MTPFRRNKPLLGTFVEIGIFNEENIEFSSLVRCSQLAFNEIMKIQNLLSFHDANSELNRINRAPNRWVEVSTHTLRVLKLARALGQLTENRFNCTVGGALVRRGALPDIFNQTSIEIGNAADIDINGDYVRLKRPVLLTLDGIAKGYAVDAAISLLNRLGLKGCWINAGGDVRHCGRHGISVQLKSGANVKQEIYLSNQAVASSQLTTFSDSYKAMFIGKNVLQRTSISVLSNSAWRADAMTKVMAGYHGRERLSEERRFNVRVLSS
ncbi:FAD:protein FMN transferase [Thalassotalea ganghwensis]